MQKIILDYRFITMTCLTIGLAPFYPEPHIVGKLRWIVGGGIGMSSLDWFDTVFHAWPWCLMMIKMIQTIYNLKLK